MGGGGGLTPWQKNSAKQFLTSSLNQLILGKHQLCVYARRGRIPLPCLLVSLDQLCSVYNVHGWMNQNTKSFCR